MNIHAICQQGDEHKKYYDTWVRLFKAKWGAPQEAVQGAGEMVPLAPQATSKGSSKSNLPSQMASSDGVDELVLSSDSNKEGGAAPAAPAAASAGGVQ